MRGKNDMSNFGKRNLYDSANGEIDPKGGCNCGALCANLCSCSCSGEHGHSITQIK